jgi:general secretion pathway protein F
MSPFSYRATTTEGRIVEGVMDADGEAAVIASLRSQGYIPLSVQMGAHGAAAGGGKGFSVNLSSLNSISFRRTRVRSRDLMIFTRELATLLQAGMPLDRSLQSLSSLTENDALKAIVSNVLTQVQEGKSLSDALGFHDSVFPPIYVNMVRAGEAGGVIETVLERLAEYLEKAEKVRDELKSAMTYPLILGVVGSGSILVLLTYVLPKFTVIFADIGAALPASTQFVMSMSDALQAYWWVVLATVAAVWAAFKRFTSNPAGLLKYHRTQLQVPLFGDLIRKVEVARFSRTLGTMLKSGVPLLQSLDIVRAVLSNTLISAAVEAVQKDVSEGKGLSGPLERTGVFPALSLQMVSVGEDTGRLDDMLLIVAEHYDQDVSNLLQRLMNMLEPAMLLIMGVVAGFIVISMLSAVFSVNEMTF